MLLLMNKILTVRVMGSKHTKGHDLSWTPDDTLAMLIPNADAVRQEVISEVHDSPYARQVGLKRLFLAQHNTGHQNLRIFCPSCQDVGFKSL